jgi:hypothetical protein
MIEVLIGTAAAIFTTLALLPSRAGPAFAEHVVRTMPLLFELLAGALSAALGGRYDAESVHVTAGRVRTAFAECDALAKQAKLEMAGYLADHTDPDAVVRTLRRLWHTEIMLLRAAAAPLPEAAVAILRPSLQSLRTAVEALAAGSPGVWGGDAIPALVSAEAAIAAVEQEISGMRQRGELRELPLDDVIRLMAFDFALVQLRLNLKDLADRSRDLAGFSGTTMPWLRRLRQAVTT